MKTRMSCAENSWCCASPLKYSLGRFFVVTYVLTLNIQYLLAKAYWNSRKGHTKNIFTLFSGCLKMGCETSQPSQRRQKTVIVRFISTLIPSKYTFWNGGQGMKGLQFLTCLVKERQQNCNISQWFHSLTLIPKGGLRRYVLSKMFLKMEKMEMYKQKSLMQWYHRSSLDKKLQYWFGPCPVALSQQTRRIRSNIFCWNPLPLPFRSLRGFAIRRHMMLHAF